MEKETEKEEVSPSYSSTLVLIENIQDNCIPEIINLLVENISKKLADIDFFIERIPEIHSAVITFTCDIDTADFIGKFSSCHRAQGQGVTARSLEESRTVRVEGIPPKTPETMIELYFESARNGGGSVQNVVMLPDENAVLVTFYLPEVLQTLMTRQHAFNNQAVSVYPYYTSIGHCLYGQKGPHTAIPDSEEIPISLHITEFISKDPQKKIIVENAMANIYCDITWPDLGHPTPVIKLSFLNTLSCQLWTLAKVAPTWKNKVHAEFSRLMSMYKVIECDLKPPVWEAIREKVSSSPNLSEPHCQVTLQNGANLVTYKGDLCQHNADVIVISSNKNLKPTGGAALALVKAAGLKLQKDCELIIQKEG
ncbi:protein mono-ADP-ribosyltransferase PARP14-like [Pyxicephalus adspersus]|uniref:protein mono-ADP-ribosyltransferase PARP14-like n=1 Tax=Pyxicephalus adspersus TaxID=30357 RepID=UPI003B5C318A